MWRSVVLFLLVFIVACNNPTSLVVEKISNTQDKIIETKKTITISKEKYDLINSFRPAVRDVAFYYVLNEDDISLDKWCLKCGKFQVWICNGYESCQIYSPNELGLNDKEKRFFWDIYNKYRYTIERQYKYEEEFNIKVE